MKNMKSTIVVNNKNAIRLSVSRIRFKKKPLRKDGGRITNSFVERLYTQQEIEDCAIASYAVCPGVFKKNKISNNSWFHSQAIYIDIDDSIHEDDALKRLEEYSIIPSFIYYTFSHTEDIRKYRIVMILDEPITKKDEYDNILKGLGYLLPECDHNCLTPAHFFFGGKKLTSITNKRVSVSHLIDITNTFLLANAKEGAKVSNVITNRKKEFIYNKDFPNKKAVAKFRKKLKKYKVNWDKLYKKCDVYRRFLDGDWLEHKELFGLISNIICFKKGAEKCIEIMKKHNKSGKTKYGDEKFKLITLIKAYKYLPQHLKNFSKCEDDHFYKNCYDVMARKKKQYDIIDKDFKPVLRVHDKVMPELYEKLDGFIAEKNNKIYLINFPCGGGKTEWISRQENVQIAFPTYALLNETIDRMKHKFIATLEIPTFDDEDINSKIDFYYKTGRNEDARSVIGEVASNKSKGINLNHTKKDIQNAKEYMANIKIIEDEIINVMTTHRHSIFKQHKQTIIFDEDPYKDVFYIAPMSITQILETLGKFEDNEEFKELIEQIKIAEPGKVISKKIIGFDKKEIKSKTDEYILGNIFDFLGSEFFTIEKNKMKEKSDTLSYFKHIELEGDRQYFIFTASPQVMLYEHAYGDRVVYLDYCDIENKGEIHQYIEFSCSQTSLKGKNCVDFVKKRIGYDPVITYMKYKTLFPNNSTSLHFWNLEGFNCYNRKDINILGTPHLPEYIYLLNGAFIGIDVNSVGEMEYLKVAYNNYYFNFMTYENKELQKLQFNFIENQLIQAIGRSRLIHNNCIVRLFSNFPVKGGIIIYEVEEENKVNSATFENNNEELMNNNDDFIKESEDNDQISA